MAITERKYRHTLCVDDLFIEYETLIQDITTQKEINISNLREEINEIIALIKAKCIHITENSIGLIIDRLPKTIYKYGRYYELCIKRSDCGMFTCFYQIPNGDFCYIKKSYVLKEALLELEENIKANIS